MVRDLLEEFREERQALIEALKVCASNWGWWNSEDPPIISMLPKHPMVQFIINEVRQTERKKYE